MADEEDFILAAPAARVKPAAPVDTEENIAYYTRQRQALLDAGVAVVRWHFFGPNLFVHTLALLDEDHESVGFTTRDLVKLSGALKTKLRMAHAAEMQGSWIWNLNTERLIRLGDAAVPGGVRDATQ